MSTVKIRAGSLFRNGFTQVSASVAPSGTAGTIFLSPPQNVSVLHRMYTDGQGFALAQMARSGAKSKEKRMV
jgi:hypothetical protein